MTTTTWVIGGRGLLGRALTAEIQRRAGWALLEAEPLDWHNPTRLASQVRSATKALLAAAGGGDWAIIWAAGAAVTASTQAQLDAELAQLTGILNEIGSQLVSSTSTGIVFYSSSAGGVYGGSADPPFNEATVPVPISPYGEFKLRSERAVTEFSRTNGLSSLIGRIANLYGPGQKLDKMQGLISQIAKAQLSTRPASIYVSLDTIRDYIYVDDCAELVCDALDQLTMTSLGAGPTQVTKILASGEGTTIASLLGHFRLLSKGHPHVMLGSSASSSLQAHDLRLRSRVWPELDRRELTTLPAGIHATILDILAGIQLGSPRN
ncbi:MAG TPA: nucleoside-diphosphate sugar epimerase [Microbacteriaceae bacterium]|jgi:UDP-glucose 4-epimerase|nr:nucleoside-diphosphate sugar epimerase [Microbacteriaceae bacterium]